MTDSKNEVITTFDQIDKDDVKHKIYEIRGKKLCLIVILLCILELLPEI